MLFVLSKFAFFFMAPSNFAMLLLTVGLGLVFAGRMVRTGRRLAALGLIVLAAFGFGPLGAWMMLPLEQRFERASAPTGDIAGIILLGGFENGAISKSRASITTTSAGERLLIMPVLARRYPEAKVIFTGGTNAVLARQVEAGPAVSGYFRQVGIAADRIVIEGKSRNTWENALYTRDVLGEAAIKRGQFLLVTSAWHMPRSMGVFRKAGFNVVAWPVDFRTEGPGLRGAPFGNVHDGLEMSDLAMKEWVGLLAYWLLGRTSVLWPGPKD